MKYFLHDTSAFDDEKVSELFIKFGYEGVGLFYVTLEKIGKQEKPIKTEVLKKQLRIGKRLEKCWKFMESLGIISSNNGETFNKQLLNFSEKYQIKSEKNAKRISEWREKQKDTKNVTHYEQVCNTPKVKVSKVNRNKDNNIIVLGSFKNIELSENELNNLNIEFENVNEAIEFLSAYKVEKSYKTKSDNLTLRRWVFKAIAENKTKPQLKQEPKGQVQTALEQGQKLYDYYTQKAMEDQQ